MQTILGPFAPYLETAIVEEIQAYKKSSPLAPLLVLVPSTVLRQHLKSVVGRQRKLSLLNVHFLTFYQLSLRIVAGSGANPPELRDDLFFEEILRQLVRARVPGADIFAGIEEPVGGCAALWQTLRDLRDALVDPQFALDAAREDRSGRTDSDRTKHLLVLFHSLLVFCRDKGIHAQADLDKLATQQAPASSFLKQFQHVFYYGFYDLTQIQIDFFHAVAQNHPTTLFFPLLRAHPGHDAWAFAERFYERHVQGYNTVATRELLDTSSQSLPATFKLFDESKERAYLAPASSWRCTIVNTFGMFDEVAAAAKEILRLVEDEGLAFHEIGVVARGLDAYGAAIKEVFGEHQIPLNTEIEEPLAQFPLIKAVTLLFNLPAKDFLRSQVIDLVSSPYFKVDGLSEGASARPDLWDLATRELAICKGLSEWRRLRNYSNRDVILRQLTHDDESRVTRIPAAQIRCLADIVDALAGDLLNLPEHDSWSCYAEAWKKLLAKYLGVGGGGATATIVQKPLEEKLLALLDQIASLDDVNDRVSLRDFGETFQYWLERSTLMPDSESVDAVRVLNAAAARGLSFRALFILGLNEGVFPRTIREDAFLRDRNREMLERDLGYKVNAKLAAFDEEKLIFTLLVGAARDKLYCSFQRSDDDGRVLAASWYLSELKRALGNESSRSLREVTIPRSNGEKANTPPFDRQELLLPEELAIRLSLDAHDPSALIEKFVAAPEIYTHGRAVVAEVDRSSERLGAFDGSVGPLSAYWNRFSSRVSPTALESYARCPFQFFVRHVLGLERLDQPEDLSGPSSAAYGELGHAILNGVYRTLIEKGYFTGSAGSIDLDSTVAAVAQLAFAEFEAENPVGYPLAWQCLKEQLAGLIGQVVVRDLGELTTSGFVPVALEAGESDQLPADWPDPLKGIAIRGRMDRIDYHPQEHRLRVIDYKFKFGAGPSVQDRDLDRSALRGERLQPPFYRLLGERWASGHGREAAAVEAKFYYIARHWLEGPLVSREFRGDGANAGLAVEIRKTIAELAGGIREGRFFIQRGAHCSHCDVVEVCRKNHPPSLWRAETDPLTRAHREIQKKDPKKL